MTGATVDDHLWLWLNKDGAGSAPSADLDELVLQRLAAAPVPAPIEVEATGGRGAVRGWGDAKLRTVLARGKGETTITAPGIRVDRMLGDRLVWSIRLRLPEDPQAANWIRALFTDLCAGLNVTYGRGHLENNARALYDEHYDAQQRTFYASGLYWLNWFGPGELERQGGIDALAANPYAKTKRMGDGLLIEVGDSYLDATTPAGVEALLAATAALPPIGAETAGADAFVATTVAGQRGMFNTSDHSFWVNVHLDPGKHMSASRVATIAALVGQGDPPVSQVNVLFSSEESARAEARTLLKLGVGIWYVDDETGARTPL